MSIHGRLCKYIAYICVFISVFAEKCDLILLCEKLCRKEMSILATCKYQNNF